MINIRPYSPGTDYETIKTLYEDSATYGGQFDKARDTKEKLDTLISIKPESILVADNDGEVVGTVTLFEDGRSAWLYRFAVKKNFENEVVALLWEKAKEIFKRQGHTQILVYAPTGDSLFEERYISNGFTKGGDYTAYWQEI